MAGRIFGTHTALAGHVAVLLFAGLVGAAPLAAGPIETLATADKELKAGNYKSSISLAGDAIASGKLAPEELARALYIRGSSYLLAKNNGLAIADLNAALWMNKLPSRLVADAKAKRIAAYSGAGVTPSRAAAGRQARTQRTVSSAAPQIKLNPAAQPNTAQSSHKVAMPVERTSVLPEGTHSRPLVLNTKPTQRRPATIIAPLPKAQTTPKWSSTTRQVQRQPIARPSTPIVPARQPTRPAAPVVTRTTAAIGQRPVPPRTVASTPRPAAQPIRPSIGQFTTETRKFAPRPANVASQRPVQPALRPTALPSTARQQPAPTPPYTPPPAARSNPAAPFNTRDGVQDDVPAPQTGTASLQDDSSGTSFFGALIGGSSRKSEALAWAEDYQRRRTERIRELNRSAAGEQPQ